MRTLAIHRTSLAVGLLIGLASWISMSQIAIPRAPTWGPPKEDIVNLYFADYQLPVIIPPGGFAPVFEVPQDRWLTVTGAWTGGLSVGYWAEELGGVVTLKGVADGYGGGTSATSDAPHRTPQECGGAVGWVFKPGSRVVFQSSGGAGSVSEYSLIGYLARQ